MHSIPLSVLTAGILILNLAISSRAAEQPPLPIVNDVEWQPLAASVRRLQDALEFLGTPLSAADKDALAKALQAPGDSASDQVQQILDQYCLCGVNINPESRVKVAVGPAKPELLEQGWRVFLVKV